MSVGLRYSQAIGCAITVFAADEGTEGSVGGEPDGKRFPEMMVRRVRGVLSES